MRVPLASQALPKDNSASRSAWPNAGDDPQVIPLIATIVLHGANADVCIETKAQEQRAEQHSIQPAGELELVL